MKNLKFLIFCFIFSLIGCVSGIDFNEDINNQVKNNTLSVFGVEFPTTQDWSAAVNGSVNVHVNTDENIVMAQVLMSTVNKTDSSVNVTVLNEANVKPNDVVSFNYDTSKNYETLLIAFINENGQYFYRAFNVGNKEVYFNNITRGIRRSSSINLPESSFSINETIETFANKRNWIPGEVFYGFDNASYEAAEYSSEFKTVFNNIIFNYFKNGRNYNNLPLLKKSGYYNESSYPITTGDEPIIVSPVYKNDGGYHEISEAELYYYYFKGDLTVSEIEALPKYKAINLSKIFTNNDNNVTSKRASYGLVYFGDGIPNIGTTGTYHFPKGYKIGFCYKSNTTTDNKKKQGELYGDGRLNYNINSWGNFKSSNLEATAPRMGWFNINDKIFLCVESGTDADYNDLILEVEGGIDPIIIPPVYEYNSYTFLFEDRRLGDYDMNDVVFKGERLNETTIKWTLMASGAQDELYIKNINGKKINDQTEVHEILNNSKGVFINTIKGTNTEFVIDVINVPKNYSFLDITTQPYIYNKTMNWDVHISRKGEDPHAIMIPYDFKWPLERICIKDAYLQFNSWGQGSVEDNDWYKYPVENLVY